ncbi:MAG: hypothetical protein K6G50_04935 [bacterium]|nr:hypothetical protein [bacterium]
MRRLLMLVMMLACLGCDSKVVTPENSANITPAEAAASLAETVLDKADAKEAMRWCSKSCEPMISSQICFLSAPSRKVEYTTQEPAETPDGVRVPVKITSLTLGDDKYTGTFTVTLDASHKATFTELTLFRTDGLKVKF